MSSFSSFALHELDCVLSALYYKIAQIGHQTVMKKPILLAFVLVSCVFSTGCHAVESEIELHRIFSDSDVIELVHAAESCKTRKIDRLIKHGTNINAHGRDGITPLIFTASVHNHEATECLLKAGASPNEKNNEGDSAVWLAAGDDDPQILTILLSHGGDPNIVGGVYGEMSPLQNAVWQFQFSNIDILLDHGADINYAYKIDNSAATLAAAQGRMDWVAHLLDRGYSHNLRELAFGVNGCFVSSTMQPWKEKVLKMLQARGVEFPLKPNPHPWSPKDRKSANPSTGSG